MTASLQVIGDNHAPLMQARHPPEESGVLSELVCATIGIVTRTAECACGRVSVSVGNEPVWVSTCHCNFCQKRTGSVFQVGAYFAPDEKLEVTGETKVYNGLEIDGVGTSGGNGVSYHFCTTCGSTVYWVIEGPSASIAIAVGNFVDPEFQLP